MPSLLLFVLLVLTSYRLQRVVTADEWPPSEWLRDKIAARTGADSSWTTLVTCPHCFGWWTSLALVSIADGLGVGVRYPVLQAIAVAGGVSLLGEWDTRQ